ncbi:MAG: YkgJ family cysteine cluster protein [Promethearchaeota archaeon]
MSDNCKNCGKCCLDTEMVLSQEDVDLIIKKYPNQINIQDFALKNKDGHLQLKNLEGHCVFFNPLLKICNIYEYRPQGCRFYPLIYDFQKKKCVFDKDCPRTHLFYNNKQGLKNSCRNLKNFLEKQLNMKIN